MDLTGEFHFRRVTFILTERSTTVLRASKAVAHNKLMICVSLIVSLTNQDQIYLTNYMINTIL